ncbi:RHS repeat-associated core domain-containing protein [Streptomyces seoulensis]
MSSITVNNKTYAGQYGSTDQSERVKLGDTLFHNGPLGLSAETTGGVDMGFNREPGGTLNSMTTGGTSYYYLTDAIGSVIGLVDVDGNKVDTYTYSPRGVRLLAQFSEPVAQPYRFAGNYQDPTGLYHLQNRYYDANIGRFTQPDPSGQEQNPYLYAEGDPVNKIDPNDCSASQRTTAVKKHGSSRLVPELPVVAPGLAAQAVTWAAAGSERGPAAQGQPVSPEMRKVMLASNRAAAPESARLTPSAPSDWQGIEGNSSWFPPCKRPHPTTWRSPRVPRGVPIWRWAW